MKKNAPEVRTQQDKKKVNGLKKLDPKKYLAKRHGEGFKSFDNDRVVSELTPTDSLLVSWIAR